MTSHEFLHEFEKSNFPFEKKIFQPLNVQLNLFINERKNGQAAGARKNCHGEHGPCPAGSFSGH